MPKTSRNNTGIMCRNAFRNNVQKRRNPIPLLNRQHFRCQNLPRLTQLQPGYCALGGTDTSGPQWVCAAGLVREALISGTNESVGNSFSHACVSSEIRNQVPVSNQSLSDHESFSTSELCRNSILLNCGRWSARARTCRRRCWRSRSGRTPARTCCATAHAQRTSPDSP